MKGNKAKLFGVVMALVLAVALASVGVVKDASADPGILHWTEITIPEEGAAGDYALRSGSEVGPIAVSPDGGTIFAASGDFGSLDTLMRSTDGGYIWKQVMTELDNVAATTFLGPIVDIVVSPDWENDDTVLVATDLDVCISGDRGVEFTTMAAPGGIITSLDAALDEDLRLALLAGDSNDVYLMTWPLGGWVPQDVGDMVLDVVFSTDYATTEQIIAVVTDGASTRVRAKFGDSAWGATITDATLFDTTLLTPAPFGSSRACIGLPDDYDAYDPTLFVGVVGDTDEGDVYLIAWAGSVWAAIDLNVRDAGVHEDTQTDIWSIAVSGDDILVGTEQINTLVAPRQYLVYLSEDGGTTWKASDKQPTGETEATVVLGSAYVGTKGLESAFSAADDAMMSWNQRGLTDAVITEINDVVPSPGYAADGTLFMVTYDAVMTVNSLWQTTDGGITWERVFCSTLTNIKGEPAECLFDMVRLTSDGGTFVAQSDSKEIRLSADDTATWSRIVAQEPITALAVASLDTLYTGDTAGNLWMTTNGAITWDKPDESDITGEITSIALGPEGAILVGALEGTEGSVYICRDKSVAYEFERVGPGAVDTFTNKMYVAFDADYDVIATIYAGSAGSDIDRFVIDVSTTWKNIHTGIDVAGLVATDDGTLYAADATAAGLTAGGVARSVNPSSIIPGEPTFEMMGVLALLPATATLEVLRVAPGNILFAVNTATDPDQLLTYTDTLTGKVIPATPTDGTTSGDILENQGLARVVLSWQGKIGASSYQYQVALDPAMLTVIDGASGYTAGQVVDVELWLDTTYYWRARVGKEGSTVGAPLLSQWSETWSFNTPLGPGAARPILENPEHGQQDVALRPVLEWSGLIDTINYELMVAEDCDWGNLAVDKTGAAALGTETVYAITADLEYGTDYCWKVKALSATSESPWSDIGTFTTIAEPTAAEAAPTPAWVWVVIAISAILLIAVLVLIIRTRRAV